MNDPARPSIGKPPPKPSTSTYAPSNKAVLQRLLEPGLGAVIAVDHDSFGLAVLDRHPERVDDQVRCL